MRKTMLRVFGTITMCCALLAVSIAPAQAQEITIKVKPKQADSPLKDHHPSVDVAILLDTSNSMDGLISQAKSQLWKIVQEFAAAEKAGKTPSLRVAVFEYGNTGLPAQENYIRQVVQLTDNLDDVSEALFSLTTNGGDEYCGAVIGEALKRLDWSNEPNSFKAIFIAGNEPFTQGPIDYRDTCKQAIEAGVIVNTIHCGDYNAGISGKWQHGAQLAEGEYMNINQDRRVVHIETPHDKVIIELNTRLNSTYLWYGDADVRKTNQSNQIRQDENALKQGGGGGFGGRVAAKGSKLYSNFGRDLVDTFEKDKSILSKLKRSQLPENMQKMSAEERGKYVEEMSEKRNEIRSEIARLNKLRQEFIEEAQKKEADSDESTLGDAITTSIRKQMEESGFNFKKN